MDRPPGAPPRSMELIPALDLRHGRVVRLRQGDDSRRTVYDLDPLSTLLGYARAGVRQAHIVDLDAALGDPPQRALIRSLVDARETPGLQLGGGLRDREAVEWALESGCERVVLTSLMVRDFDLFAALSEEHPGRLVPALDLWGEGLRVSGWTESASVTVDELCRRLAPLPLPALLVTDIERDGTLVGPNVEMARRISRAVGKPALLSGGVRCLDDLRAARQVPEISGAIVGRALYDGAFTVEEALAVVQEEAV